MAKCLLLAALPALGLAATQETITKNIMENYEAAPHTFSEDFLKGIYLATDDSPMDYAFEEFVGQSDRLGGAPPPAPPPNGAWISGVFSDSAVLQRAPAKAAIFGAAGTIFGNGTIAPDSGATVTVSIKEGGGGSSYTVTATAATDGGWKVLLKPAQAGGDYTISAACTSGCAGKQPHAIVNVTFGVSSTACPAMILLFSLR